MIGRPDIPGTTSGTSGELLVRAMQVPDAPAVARIYSEGVADRLATFETRPRTESDVAGWPGSFPVVVVERDGQVVAWASAPPYRPRRACYAGVAEFSVYVAREARGCGAGRAALHGLVSACRAAGYWKLVSRVFPENEASLALCHSAGFRSVGVYRRHGMLEGRWRDCVIVERLIDDEPDGVSGHVPAGSPDQREAHGVAGSGTPDGLGARSGAWLACFEAQALAIEAVAADAQALARPVPLLVGWTVGEVLRHLGVVHRVVHGWVTAGRRPAHPPDGPPAGEDVRSWYARGWRRLYAELAARPAGNEAATWNPADTTIGFWQRRMAHELAVHGMDVMAAAALPWSVSDELAADGVDEALRLWLGTRLGPAVGGDGRMIRVETSGQRWMVGLHPQIVEVHGLDLTADATISAPPAELYRWVWGRAGSEVIRTDDPDSAGLLRAVLARAMQ